MLVDALAPWFATADRLVPRWREWVEAQQPIVVTRPYGRTDAELLELRETLELFAFALATQSAAFVAAVREDDEAPAHLTQCRSDQLRLHVEASRWTYPLEIFFEGWTDASASDEFLATKQVLQKLGGATDRENRATFAVDFQFQLSTESAAQGVKLLASVDPEVFHIETLSLIVRRVVVDAANVASLFRSIELFRADGTDVTIKLELSGQEQQEKGTYAPSKALFELVARRGDPIFGVLSSGGSWNVTIECSEHDTAGEYMINLLTDRSGTEYTIARVFIASLLPLVHGNVSHVSLIRPLEDESAEWGDYNELPVRAKWLAFLLRFSRCRSWSLSLFPDLQDEEESAMQRVFVVETATELLDELWMEEWGNTEDYYQDDFSPEEVTQLHNDIRGVVNEKSQPTEDASLSLRIRTTSLHSSTHLSRLGGHLLNELSIDISDAPIWIVGEILDSCPSLSKLSLSCIRLDIGDPDRNRGANRKHLLRSLAIGFECMDVLESFPAVLHEYSIQLEALHLFLPENHQVSEPTKDPNAIMDSILKASCGTLATLSISRLSASTCGLSRIWAAGRVACPVLSTLALDGVVWQGLEWHEFLLCLEDESHPLTRSLETICLCHPAQELDIPAFFAMLEANLLLTNVDLTVSDVGALQWIEWRHRVLATDGRVTRRLSGPLPIRQKLALLSAFSLAQVRWDIESVSQVFAFAASTASRQVTVTPSERNA